MPNKVNTLRMVFPDWQHGANPSSGMVSRLLATLAPQNGNFEQVEVKAPDGYDHMTEMENLYRRQSEISEEHIRAMHAEALRILEEKRPEHVVTFSTDGAASLAPMDYLHERYPDLGILWIDVHQENTTPERFWKKRVVIFSALNGDDQSPVHGLVNRPVKTGKIMYVSHRPEDIPPITRLTFSHLLRHQPGPVALEEGSTTISDWLRTKGIGHLSVHLDLDSVGAADLRSGILREQDQEMLAAPFDPDVLTRVGKLLLRLSHEVDIVGLDVMEYEMVNAPEYHDLMANLPILNK